MPTQLPSGRWRTRVRHPRTGKHLSARAVIGGPETYENRESAAAAENEAKQLLRTNARAGVTVREFWNDWTTDPPWMRPAESTNVHRRERTTKFVERVRAPADPGDRRRARRRLDQGRSQPRHRPAPADVLQRRRHRPGGQARRPQPVRQARTPRQPRPAGHDASRPGRDRQARTTGRRTDTAVVRRLPRRRRPPGDASRRTRRAHVGADRLPGRDDPRRSAVEREGAEVHAAEARCRSARSRSPPRRASGC